MRYPPRLAHLATRAAVVAKLWPTFAAAHEMDEEEAEARLTSALQGQLLDELLAHAWEAMRQSAPRADESALLEKVAQTLSDRPRRAGRTAKLNSAWSAFLLLADLQAGGSPSAGNRARQENRSRGFGRGRPSLGCRAHPGKVAFESRRLEGAASFAFDVAVVQCSLAALVVIGRAIKSPGGTT